MKIGLTILFLCCFSIQAQDLMDFNKASDTLSLLPSKLINTPNSERDFALSPDGRELFFTIQTQRAVFQTIFYSKKKKDGSWTTPVIAPFAGQYSDIEPAFSYDGQRIYFSSNRPLYGTATKDFDIWMVEKSKEGWSKPINLGAEINTVKDEFYPSVTKDGHIYFTAAYDRGIGKEDIYVARLINGRYEQPMPLDTAINTKFYEFNAFISPDESFILFTSYGRQNDKGGGDLYMSKKDAHGKWLPARHLDFLSSNKIDYCPFVSFDKKTLFFTSERTMLKSSYAEFPITTNQLLDQLSSNLNGGGNIYWIKFDIVLDFIK